MDQVITQMIDILVSEKYLDDNNIKDIFTNQKVIDMIHIKNETEEYDVNKCNARVWKDGLDNVQCNCLRNSGEEYCITHCKRIQEKGYWWLGKMNEEKPKCPIYYDGIVHQWKNSKEIEREIEIEREQKCKEDDTLLIQEPIVKRKRGRPKGSKNKKKKEKNMSELTKEDILSLLKDKEKDENNVKMFTSLKKESEIVQNEIQENIYKIDNVPYELDGINIMDPFDYSPIGIKDGKGGIIFEDDDAKRMHFENMKKYINS